MLNEITLRSPFRYFNDLERELQKNLNQNASFEPAISYKRDKNKLYLNIDIPGVEKEDLDIELKEDKLIIKGERKDKLQESDYSEKYFGKFEKRYSLPKDLDLDKLEARYVNGVLSIEIENSQKENSRKILIN